MKLTITLVFILLSGLFSHCEKPEQVISIETPDWTEASHGSSASPDYAVVFPNDKLQRIDLLISESDWAAIEADLADLPRSGPGPESEVAFEPIWVPCDFHFNGKQWYKTGIRVKGNSSLRTTYELGIHKYSFKIDFDQFEDTYPAINDQRFFGFRQLNLNNNFDDQSLMREKVAGELFRDFGIPAARSSFCELYINTGSGAHYFGLYTLVEEVDDTVIGSQFADGNGNLYKPEGSAATFASGTYDTGSYNKKTHETGNDFSDIKKLYDALHNELRTTDPTAWRQLMESALDTGLFLKWLAANTVMQNWDTYGRMTHNYYLYQDPSKSTLTWIPWDNNEALQDGKMGGAINLDLSGVSSQWPLISYFRSDSVYFDSYRNYAKEFAATVFDPARLHALYDQYDGLIRNAALREVSGYTFLRGGESGYDRALSQLRSQAADRVGLVRELFGKDGYLLSGSNK